MHLQMQVLLLFQNFHMLSYHLKYIHLLGNNMTNRHLNMFPYGVLLPFYIILTLYNHNLWGTLPLPLLFLLLLLYLVYLLLFEHYLLQGTNYLYNLHLMLILLLLHILRIHLLLLLLLFLLLFIIIF